MTTNPDARAVEIAGRRIRTDPAGYLTPLIDQPASYGRATAERIQNTPVAWWQVTAPDGSMGMLNPEIHTVVEHEDGTITVTPSLDFSKRTPPGWHGWLTRGIFRSV